MSKRAAPRMAVIGFDSADPSLVEQWSDKGLLPAFARLRRQGTWVNLQNRGEFPSTTIWPSIYTGAQPGKYGIYYIIQIAQGAPKLELVGPENCRQPPFWTHLGACGKSSIVLDVPFTYPVPGVRGLQICNWGSYERYAPAASEPREALGEIERRFGRYPFGAELSRNAPITDQDLRSVRRKLLDGVRVKGEAIRGLMSERDWDFFIAVFAETHPAGHYFWGPDNSSSAPKLRAEFNSTLLDVYKSVDNEIGKIADSLDERTTLMLVSGHGMGANNAGWHLLPGVLGQMGLSHSEGGESRSRDGASQWLSRLRGSIPRRWRDFASRSLPHRIRDALRVHWAGSGIDWLKDRAFSLPADGHGFVRVNLKGRDSNGNVDAGPEYKEICGKISLTLKSLSHPQTGKPVVEEVFLTDEVFPGPERDKLPDLIVSWRDGGQIDAVTSKEIGTVSGKLPDSRRGNHRGEGFALLCGPGVAKGRKAEGHLLDIAPTVLSFYGAEPPGSMDGRSWTNLLGL